VKPPGVRMLYGVLGLLLLALAALGVRIWQGTSEPARSPVALSSMESEAPVQDPSGPSLPSVAAEPTPNSPSAPEPEPSTTSPRSAPRATLSASIPRAPAARSTPAAATLRGVVIAIDPGHNGANGSHPAQINRPVDAGGFRKACNTTGTAANDGYSEATFNWQLARRVAAILTARGAVVRMTRSNNGGWGPCVDARGRFGAAVRAKVELSLHADGAAASGYGFHVIAPAFKRGYTDDILPMSQRLAVALRDSLVAARFSPSTYLGSRGLDTRSDLGTLNLANVPTAMVECGNMRNAGDAALLRSVAGQTRLATGLADGLARYLAHAVS
jgi:N-acetylmuramoyl-L-alanine amidase